MKKRHLSTVSLFALMGGVFMISGATTAHATSGPPPACPSALVPSSQLSAVTDDVSFNGSTYDYSYRVCNLSAGEGFNAGEGGFLIRDWEIPIFGEYDGSTFVPEAGGIDLDTISSPDGWEWAIEEVGVANGATGWDGEAAWQDEADPWNVIFDDIYGEDSNPYDDNQFVLHWYVDPGNIFEAGCFAFDPAPCIGSFENLDGFGFSAGLSSVAAPFQTSWVFLPVNTGDPAIPGQGGGGGLPGTQSVRLHTNVAEPGALGLLGAGLFGMAMLRRRKK